MKNILKREQIQSEALQAWIKNNKRGTIEIITGLGKTKIAMEAIKLLPKASKILFLAEVKDREKELRNEAKKWKVSHKVDFLCYQSAYKLKKQKYDLVIADEIHDSLTTKYSEFYTNNQFSYILGLSATVDANAWADEDNEITKGDMIKIVAPICYTYNIDDGQRDGTSRKLNIHVIRHKLDMKNKNVKAGNKKKPFMQTEWSAYQYWSKQMAQAFYMPENIKLFRIRTSSAARAKILWNLESKSKATKILCEKLKIKKKRTILFGNSLEALEKITSNVVSSNNDDKTNIKIREDFDKKKTNLIGSFKKLKQGANLVDLDTCIIMSYYSKSKDLIQRIGRMRNDGTLGNVYIFMTMGTQEEKWFDNMFKDTDSLNMIYYNNINDCIKKIK